MDLKDATHYLPRAVASRVAFSIGSDLFTWADVLRSAVARGSWQEHLVSVRDAVVAGAHALSADNAPTADDVGAVTTKFRYDRNLISGDDLLKWLAQWDISMLDWEESLRRVLSRECFSDELDGLRDSFPADDAAIAAAIWPDTVCSGFIERAGEQLCSDLALALGSGCPTAGRARPDFERIQAAADVARSNALNREALAREVTNHRLEWTAVRGWWLALPDEDMAKEAAMCVRNDGSSLANVTRE